MPTRRSAWPLTLLLAVACTVLAWSIGVTLSEDVDDPDFLFRPVDALLDHRAIITAVALLVGGVAAFGHLRLRRSGRAVPDDVAVPVLMIGAVIGIAYSVVTAPTIGANIGGGIVIVGGPIAVLALAVASARAARRHRAPTAG